MDEILLQSQVPRRCYVWRTSWYTTQYTIVFSYFAQNVPNCIPRTKQSYKQAYRIFLFFLELSCTTQVLTMVPPHAATFFKLWWTDRSTFLLAQGFYNNIDMSLWYLCQRFRDHLIERLAAWFQVCLLQPWLLCPCSHHWKSLVWSQGRLVGWFV